MLPQMMPLPWISVFIFLFLFFYSIFLSFSFFYVSCPIFVKTVKIKSSHLVW